jgi:tetratricopeptide (TPR) repeat protein
LKNFFLVFILFFSINVAFSNDIILLIENGQFKVAENQINSKLNSSPNDLNILVLKGILITKSESPQKGLNFFLDLDTQFKNTPEILNNIGVVYSLIGNSTKAIYYFEKAIKSKQFSSDAYTNLRNSLAKIASETYSKALNIKKEKNKLNQLTFSYELSSQETKFAKNENINIKGRPLEEKLISNKQALDLINKWIGSWTDNDFISYKNSYINGFKGRFSSHQGWLDNREPRVKYSKNIIIKISNLQIIEQNNDKFKVSFTQDYSSNVIKSLGKKTLEFTLVDNNYKISNELFSK